MPGCIAVDKHSVVVNRVSVGNRAVMPEPHPTQFNCMGCASRCVSKGLEGSCHSPVSERMSGAARCPAG